MIESATLSESDRRNREIDRLRGLSQARPDDPALQLHLADLLLAGGSIEEAAVEFRQLLTLDAGAVIWEEAGRSLLSAEQYPLARQFLERAIVDRPLARLILRLLSCTRRARRLLCRLSTKSLRQQRAGDFLLIRPAFWMPEDIATRRARFLRRAFTNLPCGPGGGPPGCDAAFGVTAGKRRAYLVNRSLCPRHRPERPFVDAGNSADTDKSTCSGTMQLNAIEGALAGMGSALPGPRVAAGARLQKRRGYAEVEDCPCVRLAGSGGECAAKRLTTHLAPIGSALVRQLVSFSSRNVTRGVMRLRRRPR